MQKQIEDILENSSGMFGVAIKHLQTGEEVVINGDRLFQLASVFKLPILATLFKEVEDQRISLSDRVELSLDDRVPGSGVLKELDAGTKITVKDLATLMIIISDNMATDKLLQLIGKQKIQSFMTELGFDHLFIQHSCWELLALSVGMNPVPYTKEKFTKISTLIEGGKFDPNSNVFKENKQNNVSTVIDLNGLLEKILLRKGFTEYASNGILDILSRQQLRQRLPHLLSPSVKIAHKTGTIGGTVNDSGIIFLPNEQGELIISVLSTGNTSVEDGAQIIAKIARIAVDYYSQL